MGGSMSFEQIMIGHREKILGHFNRVLPLVLNDGPKFVEEFCQLRTSAFVRWDTLLEAFDLYMCNRHPAYIELKRETPRAIKPLFKHFLCTLNVHCHGSVVSGITLINFPTCTCTDPFADTCEHEKCNEPNT